MITDLDGIINGLANQVQVAPINKASIATQAAGGFSSLWRATGIPAQGAIPAAAAICDKTLTGALLNFTNAGGGESLYLARVFMVSGNSGTNISVYDRLAHMGGLSGVTTGSQTAGVDITSLAGTRCAADFSDVTWWADIYADVGTSAQTCTVTYTRYPGGAGNTGRTTTFTLGGASPANQDSRSYQIIPTGADKIQSIESVSIPVSTGTAGSWGITASKSLSSVSLGLSNAGEVYDWAQLGLPAVPNDACLYFVAICGTTSTGTLIGSAKLIRG